MRAGCIAAFSAMALIGCEGTSGDVNGLFRPVPVDVRPVEGAESPATAPVDDGTGFDFSSDAAEDDESADDVSADELAARLLGVDPAEDSPPAPDQGVIAPVPAVVPAAAPADQVAIPPPSSLAAVPVGWGIRLIDTLRSDPPMAYLGMPSGAPLLVKAGDLLPEVGIVVLAVGTDAVQVAEVIPQGDHVRVEPRVLSRLSP